MKNIKRIFKQTILTLITGFALISVQAQERQLFEIKTYTLGDQQQEQVVDAYLKEAYLPALKRMGIGPIGVFKPRTKDKNGIADTIVVLTPFKSFEEFGSLHQRLREDKTHNEDGKPYLQAAHDQKPYLRISTTLLTAFEDMPQLSPSPLAGPKEDRVYELRSYESATEARYRNKVKMFNEGGEVVLFDRLGFNAVFYGEVISGGKMPNLMYMTTFKDQTSRDAHWKSFSDDPEWKTLSARPEYQNNVSHIDILFLYPTEYSEY
tara:strand:+ start:74558 stop:75349 length:792 start_codon:yes stop_codon:yes gene_type:complete